MITRTLPTWHPDDWRRELAQGYRDPAKLLAALGLCPDQLTDEIDSDQPFPLRVPLSYVRRMRRGDPADPLLRQVLPLVREREAVTGHVSDPVGDLAANRGAGVLHKYHGRALLITTGACAIHCRYCFRREFPYGDTHAGGDDWQAAVEILSGDRTIREVILSGGDPLSLSTPRIAALISRLENIPHLRRLRVHSRLPIVLPSRVEPSLLELFTATRLQTVMVVHANHPNEIDKETGAALTRIRETGTALLNQSVLLRGVNDDPETLIELSEILFSTGVMPYYLHRLDRVHGTAHFDLDDTEAQTIHRMMQQRLPGYLLPRLVQELPGAASKLALGSDHDNSLI